MADAQAQQEPQRAESLPKLSAADHRTYNRMADMMEHFHNHFRSTWNMMYQTCSSGKRPGGVSIRQFLNIAEEFCSHLTMHHTIEERHIFPILAKKMPAFRKELELLTQHKQIHVGLDKFEDYISKCRTGETDLRFSELKEIMDTFGGVLWEHLDDEVKQLKADNMRKYWSLQEMRSMPF